MAILVPPSLSSRTKVLGLIGQGITHSLSPKIHNFSAKILGRDAIYLPFDVPESTVEKLLHVFWESGGAGFNVTMPHKALVASLVTEADQPSINTLYRGETGWRGTSTDGQGFAQALTHLQFDFASFNRFVILGSGGAAMALLAHMRLAFVGKPLPEVVIARRNPERDAELRRVAPPECLIEFISLDEPSLREKLTGRREDTILVQATSAPLRGDHMSYAVPALSDYHGVLVDLVYGAPSALYQAARNKRLAAQDGLPMLIEQARLSQNLWWGESARYEDLARLVGVPRFRKVRASSS